MRVQTYLSVIILSALLVTTGYAQTENFRSGDSAVTVVRGEVNAISVVTTSATKVDVRILGRVFVRISDCEPLGLPSYKVVDAPHHGSLCYRDERDKLINHGPNPNGSCIGRETILRFVYLQPELNYVGTDTFKYEVTNPFGKLTAIADVKVTLTPSSSPLNAAKGNSLTFMSQSGDLIPPCAVLEM